MAPNRPRSRGSMLIKLLTYIHRMAPIPPQIEHKEDPHNENLIDVDGPHVRSIEREFADYTDTQAHRVEREAEDAEITARHEKEKAASKAKELKNKAHAKEQELMRNKDNPVIIGNTAILGIGAVALG